MPNRKNNNDGTNNPRNISKAKDGHFGHRRQGGGSDRQQSQQNPQSSHLQDSNVNSIRKTVNMNMKPGKSITRGKVVDTHILQRPVLRELKPGFSLGIDNIPENMGQYDSPWNARSFANKQSTHFSSFKLSERVEKQAGAPFDFVSDWENMKKLMQSSLSSSSQSFIVHKVGKSLYVDNLDLIEIIMRGRNKGPCDWLHNYVYEVIHPYKEIIKTEGKSNREVIGKAVFHKLLYCSIAQGEEGMKFKTKGSDNCKNDKSQLPDKTKPEISLPGSMESFLQTVTLNVDKYSMLVGTNVPLYRRISSCTSLTLRSHDSSDSDKDDKVNPFNGLDMWLDNILLDVPETFVVHQKNESISSTDWIKTEDFPRKSGFDFEKALQSGLSAFEFLKTHAVSNGHTYWFFKSPGNSEFKCHDLTSISNCKNKKDNYFLDTQNPFWFPFATLLYRTLSAAMDDDMEKKNPESLTNDAVNLFDSKQDNQEMTDDPCVKKFVSEMAVKKLFKTAMLMLNSFEGNPCSTSTVLQSTSVTDTFESHYDTTFHREWNNRLSNAIRISEKAFKRLKIFSNNMAGIIASKMAHLYELFEETYSITDESELPKQNAMTLSGAFECISNCLTEALRLDIGQEEYNSLNTSEETAFFKRIKIPAQPQPFSDVLPWMLSSIMLSYVKYLLEYYPYVPGRPIKACAQSYTVVTKLLDQTLEVLQNADTPFKYPTSRERRERIVEINLLLGDVLRNQTFLMIEEQSPTSAACLQRWEPLNPDAILYLVKSHSKRSYSLSPRPFGLGSDPTELNKLKDLKRRAMIAFQNVCNETDDPFEALTSYINIMDIKFIQNYQSQSIMDRLSEVQNYFPLVIYLRLLKDKLDDEKDTRYQTKFKVDSRTHRRSDFWKKTLGLNYIEDTAPFLVILRIAVRMQHDIHGFLTFSGRGNSTDVLQSYFNSLNKLLVPYKAIPHKQALIDSDKTAIGRKNYLDFEYFSKGWKYSDFVTVLDALIFGLNILNGLDFKWVNDHAEDLNVLQHDIQFRQAYAKESKNIYGALKGEDSEITFSKNNTGRGDGDFGENFGGYGARAKAFYKNNKLNSKIHPPNQTPREVKRNLVLDAQVDLNMIKAAQIAIGQNASEASSSKNMSSHSKATKSKKLRKGEIEYIVSGNSNETPYDVDQIVENVSAASEINVVQKMSEAMSKKKKNKNKKKCNKKNKVEISNAEVQKQNSVSGEIIDVPKIDDNPTAAVFSASKVGPDSPDKTSNNDVRETPTEAEAFNNPSAATNVNDKEKHMLGPNHRTKVASKETSSSSNSNENKLLGDLSTRKDILHMRKKKKQSSAK